MESNKLYHVDISSKALLFTTTSFRPEPGSALHSGIYNRELASSLASGTVLVAIAVVLLYFEASFGLLHLGAALALFFACMVFFRKYVFFEENLRLNVDKAGSEVQIYIKQFRPSSEVLPLDKLRSVRTGRTFFVPDNLDGIAVVKQISAQHGMAIPGFGEPKEFHSVVLEFPDERDIVVFTSEDRNETLAVRDLIKNFIGGSVAQTD